MPVQDPRGDPGGRRHLPERPPTSLGDRRSGFPIQIRHAKPPGPRDPGVLEVPSPEEQAVGMKGLQQPRVPGCDLGWHEPEAVPEEVDRPGLPVPGTPGRQPLPDPGEVTLHGSSPGLLFGIVKKERQRLLLHPGYAPYFEKAHLGEAEILREPLPEDPVPASREIQHQEGMWLKGGMGKKLQEFFLFRNI